MLALCELPRVNPMLLLLLSPLINCITISLQDSTQILQVSSLIAKNVAGYYKDTNDGAIPQNSATDESGIQWYESGILWMTLSEYTRATNDNQFAGTWTSALSRASYGDAADFLGGPALAGLSATLLGKCIFDLSRER